MTFLAIKTILSRITKLNLKCTLHTEVLFTLTTAVKQVAAFLQYNRKNYQTMVIEVISIYGKLLLNCMFRNIMQHPDQSNHVLLNILKWNENTNLRREHNMHFFFLFLILFKSHMQYPIFMQTQLHLTSSFTTIIIIKRFPFLELESLMSVLTFKFLSLMCNTGSIFLAMQI